VEGWVDYTWGLDQGAIALFGRDSGIRAMLFKAFYAGLNLELLAAEDAAGGVCQVGIGRRRSRENGAGRGRMGSLIKEYGFNKIQIFVGAKQLAVSLGRVCRLTTDCFALRA
jgi:hypothetical protein